MTFLGDHIALTRAAPDFSGPIVLWAFIAACLIGLLWCSWREVHRD